MEGKNHNETKKKIKECKKRLNNLKLQGFTFSKRIYEDLKKIEKKIQKPTLFNQIGQRKVPVFSGIIGIFVIILILGIIINEGEVEEPIKLTVNNLINGTIIDESILIHGYAEKLNAEISRVQVKIDDGKWENATGTEEWEYMLNIDSLENGPHILHFRCFDDNENKSIIRNFIVKKISEKPTVSISNLDNSETVSKFFTIKGTATSATEEIERVEIKIGDESNWTIVNGTNNWNFTWNTSSVKNGICDIYVRSNDTNGICSDELHRYVIVKNVKRIIPPGGLFVFYIFNDLDSMIPNKNYTLELQHKNNDEGSMLISKNIKTKLKVNLNQYNYLYVSIPNEVIITPADGRLYKEQITVSISDGAPTGVETQFTIVYTYGLELFMDLADVSPFLEKALKLVSLIGVGHMDIQFSTGQW